MRSKAQTTKAKINKWDYIKLKICTTKKVINKMKKQLMDLQIMCLIRGQYPRYKRNSYNLIAKKIPSKPIKKYAKT